MGTEIPQFGQSKREPTPKRVTPRTPQAKRKVHYQHCFLCEYVSVHISTVYLLIQIANQRNCHRTTTFFPNAHERNFASNKFGPFFDGEICLKKETSFTPLQYNRVSDRRRNGDKST
ncbi:hypothetical protein TGCAST_389820 [Toxoplasma gondii CAST]|uniref:Uncharacterized protein n=1 Tax=Toxoplasma gondii CAST TaxID=943122 RepID=A0A3R7YIX8_TOXGO|nr:hypothetical protein TGCAST_389820 [Toxoplasma gondii CAST]